MSRRDTSLTEANAAAVAQRQRLRQRIDATRTRLLPSRLKFDAEQKVEQVISDGAQKAVGQVKAHPVATGFGIAAIIAWTFREPLLQHGPTKLRTAYDWLTSHLPFSDEAVPDDSEPDTDDHDYPPPTRETDMADIDWKSRIADSRDAAQAGVETLSASAREAVATARDRIGSTYGAARQRGGEIADTSRELARTGIETGTRLAAQGKDAAEKAAFSARGLVAERPLTAIAVGIAAGLVLGFLANRLASGASEPEPVEDEEIYD